MKTKIFLLSLMLAILSSAVIGKVAYAQDPTCVDPATGGTIPCQPTDAPSGGDDNDNNGAKPGGNQNPPPAAPTATVPPVPTSTPLPLALPESDFLGSCTNDNLDECIDQFKCEDGLLVIEVDLYSGDGTKYDFYCIPHESDFLKELPLAIPPTTGDDGTDYKYAGVCHHGDGYSECISDFVAQCDADGGLYDEIESGKGATVATCELPEQAAPTEAPVIAAAPTDNGSAEGNGETSKPSPWTPWIIVGALAILIGLLLPAVQKIREAAARAKTSSNSAKVDLINKDDDGTEAQDYLLEIDGVKGESKQHIKKAVLHVRKAGKDQQEY